MEPSPSHPLQLELARRLLRRMRAGARAEVPVGEVPAEDYLSEARLAAERALLARLPPIVALDAELAPGACVAVDVAGRSMLLTRSPDGGVRGFRNACRHRGTRLVEEGPPCPAKAIVCPYHGWTYDLAGRRLHVPHEAAFDGRAAARDALVPATVQSRHGFVWASFEPFDLDQLLAPVDAELASLGAASAVVYRRTVREVRGNWKLVIDAFLDAYHIRSLHRDTVYRFFLDAEAEAEPAGRHIRAVTARRALLEAGDALAEEAPLRQLVTPSYLIFPSTIFVLHPDYLSVMSSVPLSVSRTRFVHWMLIPRAPRTPAEAEHYAKSFQLIDEGVFAAEDLRIVEAMQHGLETGADRTLLFGRHEHAALAFHHALRAELIGNKDYF